MNCSHQSQNTRIQVDRASEELPHCLNIMNCSFQLKRTVSQADPREFSRKTAIHEAGHAAAIYLGNKQKQLPPVFFQIYINELNGGIQLPGCSNKSTTNWIAKGLLIHTLPSSFEEAIRDFSEAQTQVYKAVFEADIINLLAGPLAEANYVAKCDNELINPRLVNINALHNYGGSPDLEIVNEYIECFIAGKEQREKKIAELFLAAFEFINIPSNWRAIMILADYIVAARKSTIECEEIISVLNARF